MKKIKILIFQVNFKTIMDFNKDIENEIVLNIKLEIGTLKNKKNETNKLSEEDIENINKDLKNKIFYKFLEELYFICFYMKIHEPELNFKFNYNFIEDNNDSIIQNDYFFYNKEEFSVIEGFPKENSICVVILYPPQYKNNNYFKGIKPYVYCIENPNEEMIEKAKIEKLRKFKKIESKSFCETDLRIMKKINNNINNNNIKNIKIFDKNNNNNTNNINLNNKINLNINKSKCK